MKLMYAALMLISSCTASGVEVQRIAHPTVSFSGAASIQFPVGSELRTKGLPYVVYLDSYEGEWKDGLASGHGILKGRYVPLPPALPKPGDLATEGVESALADRMRANESLTAARQGAAFIASANEVPIEYRGAFEDGMASGPGDLRTPQRRLRGQFARWLPDGFVVHFVGSFPVLGETFIDGAPADGPVFVNQYRAGSPGPTRTFVGTVKGGRVSGGWFEIAYTAKGEGYEHFVLGDRSVVVYSDGRTSDCRYDASWLLLPSATDLQAIRGDAESRTPAFSDPMYLRSPVRCTSTDTSGWVYGFGLTGTGPYDQRHVPPYTCSDPLGRPGQLTIGASDIPQCSVSYVETKYRWGSKIGKAIEEAARDVRDAIVNPLNKLGEKGTEHLCGIAQKKPGKNCNINVSGGVTLDIPDSKSKTEQRAREELDRFLAARRKLLEDGGTTESLWRSAALSYSACEHSCTGPAQVWARVAITQMASILLSGLSEEGKRRQIASLSERLWQVFEKYLPGMETVTTVYSTGQLNDQLFAAKMYSWDLMNTGSTDQKLRAAMFHSEVVRLWSQHGVKSLLESTSETLSLSNDFILRAIPNLTERQQVALIHHFVGGKNMEYFHTYLQIDSARALVQSLIDAKLKELRLPPMPAEE